MSSVITKFARAEDVNRIMDEGLAWQDELVQCERYGRGWDWGNVTIVTNMAISEPNTG